MMRLAGFPVTYKLDKPCSKEYCGNGNFKQESEEVIEYFANL